MVVPSDAERLSDTLTEIESLEARLRALSAGRIGPAAAAEALVHAGALEAAILDGLEPAPDGAERAWRALTLETAKLFRWAQLGEPDRVRLAVRRARRLLAEARRTGLPQQVRIPAPSAARGPSAGAYLIAAERFLKSSAPFPSVVIGLRGPASGRSAVVTAAIEAGGREAESVSFAPARGHPQGIDLRLAERLRRRARAGAWFLVVDERGEPDAVCAAAQALNDVGAGDEQIVLFPASALPPSAETRARWGRHRKVEADAGVLRLA